MPVLMLLPSYLKHYVKDVVVGYGVYFVELLMSNLGRQKNLRRSVLSSEMCFKKGSIRTVAGKIVCVYAYGCFIYINIYKWCFTKLFFGTGM